MDQWCYDVSLSPPLCLSLYLKDKNLLPGMVELWTLMIILTKKIAEYNELDFISRAGNEVTSSHSDWTWAWTQVVKPEGTMVHWLTHKEREIWKVSCRVKKNSLPPDMTRSHSRPPLPSLLTTSLYNKRSSKYAHYQWHIRSRSQERSYLHVI